MRVRTSDYAGSSQTGGIMEAQAALPPSGGEIVVDASAQPSQPVTITKSSLYIHGICGSVLDFAAATKAVSQASILLNSVGNVRITDLCLKNVQHGITNFGSVSDLWIERLSITNALLAGVWLGHASHVHIRACKVTGYNSTDNPGVSALGVIGCCDHVWFEDNHAWAGTGHGIGCAEMSATEYPRQVFILNNHVEHTTGQATEGITPGGHDILVQGNTVNNCLAAGLLIYAGIPGLIYGKMRIIDNEFYDNSLAISGGQAGIEICPTSNVIDGLIVSGNYGYDDQASPTQARTINAEAGGQGGTLINAVFSGNGHGAQRYLGCTYLDPKMKQVNVRCSDELVTS